MKRITSLILACLLLLGLAACSSAPAETTPPADDTPVVDTTPVTPDEPVEEPADETPDESIDVPTDEIVEEPIEEPADGVILDDLGNEVDPELASMMDAILEGADIQTMLMRETINAERYYWYFGTETAIEGFTGYAVEPMIGSIPLSIALMKLPEGTDAAAVAADLEGTVDARKWICVEAESKIIKHNEQYVLVVLASTEIADVVAANFDAYFAG